MNKYKYNEIIETLNQQFSNVLDEFKSSYILYQKNPENNEYSRIFTLRNIQVDVVDREMFVLTNDIQNDINELNNQLINLDKNIKTEKKENDGLIFKLQQLKGNNNGAIQMNDNFKELYKFTFLSATLSKNSGCLSNLLASCKTKTSPNNSIKAVLLSK